MCVNMSISLYMYVRMSDILPILPDRDRGQLQSLANNLI